LGNEDFTLLDQVISLLTVRMNNREIVRKSSPEIKLLLIQLKTELSNRLLKIGRGKKDYQRYHALLFASDILYFVQRFFIEKSLPLEEIKTLRLHLDPSGSYTLDKKKDLQIRNIIDFFNTLLCPMMAIDAARTTSRYQTADSLLLTRVLHASSEDNLRAKLAQLEIGETVRVIYNPDEVQSSLKNESDVRIFLGEMVKEIRRYHLFFHLEISTHFQIRFLSF